ncbi:ACP phosphodiesterase [Dokdonia pacifica]|uniref:Acyl carrier protein phosphodiesterase n=1 Tax=Dokdonia pacifica TaxID=1627892 RepID=A0A239DYD3_9FLAO|nr:acyl carrier protein phosphodiesterase [Dokdonia pacifica]GGG41361.1 ACP phosphodiesterase [Dokdonia pacifica]SNS36654.1 Acyl carrier protein phosphodiesterase [Dokdonia pacifica]
MNFLAHIYLSGDDDMITIGNFIADGIKGKKYLKYPEGIQKGILIHRWIDSYTDSHVITKQSTKRLHAKYGHYSGVIVDILYDHFLAKNWHQYHEQPLETYVDDFYELLKTNHHLLTSRIQKMMIPMMKQNWLLSYATLEGIETVLYNMNIRIKNRVPMDEAIQDLKEHYDAFEKEFTSFFEELQAFVAVKIKEV